MKKNCYFQPEEKNKLQINILLHLINLNYFKDKKNYDGYSSQKYKTPNKEENQTALRFCTAYSGLESNGNETTKPLGKEIREMGRGWWG